MKPQATGAAESAVVHSQTAQARDNAGATAQQLFPEQREHARVDGVVRWTGTVETISVPLGVVWIREDGLGERKMLDLREYQVYPQDSEDG